MKASLSLIESYFNQDKTFPRVMIRGNEKIQNPRKTVLSMILFLKSNSKKKGYMPYWDTILLIYQECLKIDVLYD